MSVNCGHRRHGISAGHTVFWAMRRPAGSRGDEPACEPGSVPQPAFDVFTYPPVPSSGSRLARLGRTRGGSPGIFGKFGG